VGLWWGSGGGLVGLWWGSGGGLMGVWWGSGGVWWGVTCAAGVQGFSLRCSLQVVRAAEEAASTLAASVQPEQVIKVLSPIVQTADYPVNLAAIKMQTRAIERTAKEALHLLLPDLVPGLLQGYDNTESSVRKASVFCLVAVYSVMGEELKPYLAQLTGSKVRASCCASCSASRGAGRSCVSI